MTTFKTRNELERLARRALGDRPSVRMEVVAIGLEEQDSWIQLPNIAQPGKFMVAGEDVKDSMLAFVEQYGVGRLECSVWHCHYHNAEPSRADLDNVPGWAKRGLLFHTPTGTTSAYTRSGVLSHLSGHEAVPSYESEGR